VALKNGENNVNVSEGEELKLKITIFKVKIINQSGFVQLAFIILKTQIAQMTSLETVLRNTKDVKSNS
jgi:hypothetical protein